MSRPASAGRALALAAALAAAATAPVAADPYIYIRISAKVILDETTGLPPSVDDAVYTMLTGYHVQDMVDKANEYLMSGYWRGYRFALSEIEPVGTPCTSCPSSNPSFWADRPLDQGPGLDMKGFEDAAKANPAAFLWRTDKVNVYFNAGRGDGAVASFPPPANGSNDVVVAGARIFDPSYSDTFYAAIFTHELGHFFDLPHPNGSIDTCCTPSTCITDGDGLASTLPDGPCFNHQQLSLFHYQKLYEQLTQAEQDSIVAIYWNTMGYLHPGMVYGHTLLDTLTEEQHDRWADTANEDRPNYLTGRTRFVEWCTGCLPGNGRSTNPYRSIASAKAVALPGDILVLRPGVYAENPLMNTPLILRATRAGPARIGN